ncbi:MAG: hypothetical protein ACLFNJ_10680 [Bacteroidales bacterium]
MDQFDYDLNNFYKSIMDKIKGEVDIKGKEKTEQYKDDRKEEFDVPF